MRGGTTETLDLLLVLLGTANLGRDAVVLLATATTPRGLANDVGIRSKASARESGPDLALVLTARQELIGLEETIAVIEEAGNRISVIPCRIINSLRPARQQFETVDNQLDRQSVAVLGHKPLVLATGGIAVVIVGCRGVQRREQRLRKAVLFDKCLFDDIQDLGMDFANSVNAPVSWLVESLVA